VLTASCSHNRTPAAQIPAAPQTAMERQIVNAIDAGDGDYQTCMLRQRVVAEPDNIEVRLELAQAYRDRGYPELALEHCRLVVARFPESAAGQLAMAKSLRASGQRKAAAENLEAFLKGHPQTSPTYLAWLGILRDEMEQWPAGEAAHRGALGLDANSACLHNNLGYNLLRQNKNEAAAAEFREALRLNPQSAVARNNLGLALANAEAKEQAVTNWQAAGDPAAAHNNLAVFYIEKGQYRAARKELDVALGYNRQFPAALKNLALVSRMEGTPATLAMRQPDQSRWSRWMSSFCRLWVGPLQDQPAAVRKTDGAE